jgi:glycosyltransferase involved in cell wall biosynthesis
MVGMATVIFIAGGIPRHQRKELERNVADGPQNSIARPHGVVFIDCTIAGAQQQVTGISRVAQALLVALGNRSGSARIVEIKAVANGSGCYRPLGSQPSAMLRSGAAARLREMARRFDEWLRDRAPNLEHALVRMVMAAGGIPSLGLATATVVTDSPPVAFHQGDVLLLADATWMIPKWKVAVQAARSAGASIVPIVYDLLPVSHPQFFAPLFCAQFKQWLVDMISLADAMVCISNATADALRAFARDHGLADSLGPVGVFPLGTQLLPAEASPRTSITEIFTRTTQPFVMVGTIEPRKNHTLVLDAFERAWSCGGQSPLIVLGKRGWQCETVLSRFASLARSGRPVTHIGDATDADLQYAYRNARCLIFPSIAEGFGLPIVEALAQGLPVIASDIPVHREVGGDRVRYIPLGDPEHLAQLILGIEDGSVALTAPQSGSIALTTWSDSAAALQSEIARLLAST